MPKSDNNVNPRAVVLDILTDINENKKFSHNVINKARQSLCIKTGARDLGKANYY